MACACAMAAALWLNSVLLGEASSTMNEVGADWRDGRSALMRFDSAPRPSVAAVEIPAGSLGVQGTSPFHAGDPQPFPDGGLPSETGQSGETRAEPEMENSEQAPIPSLVEAATVRVSQEGGTLTEQETVAVLTEAGAPEEWIPALVSISWCESKHSPGAVGDGGNSLGQWQLWSGWFRAAGFSVDQAFDPLVNAKVAVYVRTVRGRFGGGGGWSCWKGPG